MLSSSEIRRQFIEYFVDRCGHTAVPSSPVVPHGDPTLLFANAGMNQFKDVFLGVGSRPYTRAVDTQKCIRAGGKHNDLEDVGKDTYHHTFFEMLGNWSFGDYFKREAIEWAWDLLTNVWGLDKSRLHVTVFAGDEADGLEPDVEAEELWKTVTDVRHENVRRFDRTDNFWEMGDTGPCGPCSEIHIDLTEDGSGGPLVNAGDASVIEIWNLVFIQFTRGADGTLTPLPAQHVDTGMGFERVAAVLQGKTSNYDTDVFSGIFDAIREVTGAAEYGGVDANPVDVAYRVLGDHVRALTAAIADGALPSNEGRGYVLRRILRRAARHGRQTLGVREPFLHRLIPAVTAQLGEAFPEMRENEARVIAAVREEEELFARTIDRGLTRFEEASEGADSISGDAAFELHATYGFPLDLTQVMADERGLAVDVEGFERAMVRHQEISRGGGTGADARASLVDVVQQNDPGATEFVGHDATELGGASVVRLLRLDDGAYVASEMIPSGSDGAVVVDRTPYYAESGGQVGDTGSIRFPDGGTFRVEDTVRVGATVFHLGRASESAALTVSGEVALAVDAERRGAITAHHTTTHLLNRGLRAVLGDHVQQRGSLVDPEKTRFDLSHGQALTDDEVGRVEAMVCADVAADLVVDAAETPEPDARRIHGLRAVFGEKYPPIVRVVSIGETVETLLANPSSEAWYERSVEFCGGTHLARTGAAGDFAIVAEESVAKGIRRVVGVAGPLARAARHTGAELESRVEAARSIADADLLAERITELGEALRTSTVPYVVRARIRVGIDELRGVVKASRKEANAAAAGDVREAAASIAASAGEAPVIVAELEGADAGALRTAMDVVRAKCPDAALLLASAVDGKVLLVASVPDGLIAKGLKAGDWIRETAKVVGGGGGGRPDMAQAGGKDPSKLPEALETARGFAEQCLATD